MANKQSPVSSERSNSFSDGEIDLRELFSAIWTGKWIVALFLSVFTFGSTYYAVNLPNVYKAQVLLAPSTPGASGGGGMARQLGGLASLAGINLNEGGAVDRTTLAIEVMKSRKFISKFIEKYELLVPLMASQGWNKESNKLKVNPDIYDEKSGEWLQIDNALTAKPSLGAAYKAFVDIFDVSQSKESGLVTLTIEHYSPYIASRWLEDLVRDVNIEMKQKDVSEAEKSIVFLSRQLERTEIAEMQSVFYQLIEEQTKTIMLSEARDEYAFTVLDPAYPPENKFKPKRAVIVILGLILGMILGLLFVLIRYFSVDNSAVHSDENQSNL